MPETVFKLPCKKCGVGIPVDEQMVTNAVALGMPLQPEHDVCPGEPAPPGEGEASKPRRFRLQLVAAEIFTDEEIAPTAWDPAIAGVEVLAAIGTTEEGANFPEIVNGPFTVWLNAHWPKFQESSAFADLPAASTAPPA